jgi:hypothetical protein
MSIRRRLAALEHHVTPAGPRTGLDRLSHEEVAAVVDLAMRGDVRPATALSPFALGVLSKARRFASVLDEMAKRQRSST